MDDHMTDSNHKKALNMGEHMCQSILCLPIYSDDTASSLADQYVHAVAMSTSASEYYAKLVSGISLADITWWEQEMSYAESNRLHDLKVMDVIGTCEVQPDTAGSTPAGSADALGSCPAVTDWLQLALDIQERQYAPTPTFSLPLSN